MLVVGEDGGLPSRERLDESGENGRDHRGHVAPDDDDPLDPGVKGAQTHGQAGERSLERRVVMDEVDVARDVRDRADRRDDDDLGRDVAEALDDVVEHRPSLDGFDHLVASESRGAATGEDDRGDSLGHLAATGALGPGTWPSGVRRRMARRSRSSRIAITYFRLVPVASRKAAGVRGRSLAIARALAARSR